MLADAKTFSSFSVNDADAAKRFYSKTLGLQVEQDNNMGGILTVHVNGGQFIAYPKPDHVAATFTVLNFVVNDIDATVRELKDKGVQFESYDAEYIRTDENNIAHGGDSGGPDIAWFKDPAGNILSVIQER